MAEQSAGKGQTGCRRGVGLCAVEKGWKATMPFDMVSHVGDDCFLWRRVARRTSARKGAGRQRMKEGRAAAALRMRRGSFNHNLTHRDV